MVSDPSCVSGICINIKGKGSLDFPNRLNSKYRREGKKKNHQRTCSKRVLGVDGKIRKAEFLNISGTWLAAHSVLCFSLFL